MLFKRKQPKVVTQVKKMLLTTLIGALFFTSCTKDQVNDATKIPNTRFFKNGTDAFQKVQKAISEFHPGEKLYAIESISYLNAKTKQYAFVFYRSDRGLKNVSFAQDIAAVENVGDWTSYMCDGACDCNVVATIGNGGVINMKCSCGSCDLLSHGGS